MERIWELVKEWGWIVILGSVGVGLLGYGVWEEVKPREVRVEIVRSDTVTPCHGEQCGQIVVDVAGAVEKPGVYRLQSGSRIGDALVAAGGVGVNADRGWVSQNLNLAKEIKDQEKIYIPDGQQFSNSASQQVGKSVSQTGKININTASESELDSLPGIGSVRAKAIIANRPYGSVEELKTKAKIPSNVYEDIKELVSVY